MMLVIVILILLIACIKETYTIDRIASDWIKKNKEANTPAYIAWQDKIHNTHTPRKVEVPSYNLWSDRFTEQQQRRYKINYPLRSYWGGCYIKKEDGPGVDRARPAPCFVFGDPGRY